MTKAQRVAMEMLSLEEARHWLSYDPDTGRITNRVGRHLAPAGVESGYMTSEGYRCLNLKRRAYLAHRMAWFLVHGVWPQHEIDHINGVKDDNRIANLRDVPHRLNSQNYRTATAASKTGILGVVPRRNRWIAQINADGSVLHLGMFDTAEAAHAAYTKAKRELHPGCTI